MGTAQHRARVDYATDAHIAAGIEARRRALVEFGRVQVDREQ